MIIKFVVRKVYTNSSRPIKYFDNLEEAIEEAKIFYKENWIDRKLNGYEITVEKSQFADEEKLRKDFAIDKHIKWASYFHEV